MVTKKEQDKLLRLVLQVGGAFLLVFLLSALAKAWLVHRALNELKALAVPATVSVPRVLDVIEPPRLITPVPSVDRLEGFVRTTDEHEKAWQKFFRPSATCAADPSTVECANAYIRAKRAFEARN